MTKEKIVQYVLKNKNTNPAVLNSLLDQYSSNEPASGKVSKLTIAWNGDIDSIDESDMFPVNDLDDYFDTSALYLVTEKYIEDIEKLRNGYLLMKATSDVGEEILELNKISETAEILEYDKFQLIRMNSIPVIINIVETGEITIGSNTIEIRKKGIGFIKTSREENKAGLNVALFTNEI